MNYREDRIEHLAKYAQGNYLWDKVGKETAQKTYWHVLKPIGNKRERICLYNILNGVNPDMYKSIQKNADHLNSSQIMCYNFFRPLIEDNKKQLISLLSQHGITISENAICNFEYNNPKEFGKDGRCEKTEFDFHVTDETLQTEVFFEIKYTEQAVGNWKKKHATLANFNNFYKPMLPLCYALKTEKICFNERFVKDFQLFRNSLRIRSEKQFSIFVYPKANHTVDMQFEAFKSDFVKMDVNIQKWYWEDLLKDNENTEFYRKYLES